MCRQARLLKTRRDPREAFPVPVPVAGPAPIEPTREIRVCRAALLDQKARKVRPPQGRELIPPWKVRFDNVLTSLRKTLVLFCKLQRVKPLPLRHLSLQKLTRLPHLPRRLPQLILRQSLLQKLHHAVQQSRGRQSPAVPARACCAKFTRTLACARKMKTNWPSTQLSSLVTLIF